MYKYAEVQCSLTLHTLTLVVGMVHFSLTPGTGALYIASIQLLLQHHTYNTTLLPNINTNVLGMFCGAEYTHHTYQ